jgi:hypothetical protein
MNLNREGKQQMTSQIARETRQITGDKVNSIISLDWEWQERKNPLASRLDISEVQGNSPLILDWRNETHDNNILKYEGNKVKVPIRNSGSTK